MTLGEKLSALRKETGLSQEELAEALDVSRQTISRWEQDACTPSPDNLARLGKVFRVPVDSLLDRHAPAAPGEQTPPPEEGARPSRLRRIFTWKRVALVSLALLLAVLLLWLGPVVYRELTIPDLEEWEYEVFDWDNAEQFDGEW